MAVDPAIKLRLKPGHDQQVSEIQQIFLSSLCTDLTTWTSSSAHLSGRFTYFYVVEREGLGNYSDLVYDYAKLLNLGTSDMQFWCATSRCLYSPTA